MYLDQADFLHAPAVNIQHPRPVATEPPVTGPQGALLTLRQVRQQDCCPSTGSFGAIAYWPTGIVPAIPGLSWNE